MPPGCAIWLLVWVARSIYEALRPRRPEELILAGSYRELEARLKRGLNPNLAPHDPDGQGKCPLLLWAVSQSNHELTELLLRHGADPDAYTEQGETALRWAVLDEDVALCDLLLTKGADPNKPSKLGVPPLFEAVHRNHQALIRLLHDHGADIERRCELEAVSGATPLLYAAERGRLEAAEQVLDCGADIDASYPDTAGTSLHIAAYGQDLATFRFLLSRGADATLRNIEGHNALHALLCKPWDNALQQELALKALLESGADPNALTARLQGEATQLTPLVLAAAIGKPALGKLLLEYGAHTCGKAQGSDGYSFDALHTAIHNNFIEFAQLLLAAGADPVDQQTGICEPLRFAVQDGFLDAARLLLQHGASAQQRHHDKAQGRDYPLFCIAAAANRVPLLDLLHSAGAPLDDRSSWDATALHFAANNNAVLAAGWLLDRGANIEARDNEGLRPLHEAAAMGGADVVDLLLARGADANARASYGRQPLDMLGYNAEDMPRETFRRIEKALLDAGGRLSASFT